MDLTSSTLLAEEWGCWEKFTPIKVGLKNFHSFLHWKDIDHKPLSKTKSWYMNIASPHPSLLWTTVVHQVQVFLRNQASALCSQEVDDFEDSRVLFDVQLYIDNKIKAKEKELECPVCFEVASAPIFMCSDLHLICSDCKPKVSICPECREPYPKKAKRHRYAEKAAEELAGLMEERAEVLNS